LKKYQVISTEAPISAFARCPALRRKTQGQAESTGAKWRNLFKKWIPRLAFRLALHRTPLGGNDSYGVSYRALDDAKNFIKRSVEEPGKF